MAEADAPKEVSADADAERAALASPPVEEAAATDLARAAEQPSALETSADEGVAEPQADGGADEGVVEPHMDGGAQGGEAPSGGALPVESPVGEADGVPKQGREDAPAIGDGGAAVEAEDQQGQAEVPAVVDSGVAVEAMHEDMEAPATEEAPLQPDDGAAVGAVAAADCEGVVAEAFGAVGA